MSTRHGRSVTTADGASGSRRQPTLLFVLNVAWFFLSHRLGLARAALASGYRVHLASDFEGRSEMQDVERAGITFHRFSVARSGMNPVRELHTVRQLRHIIRQLRPDIVHNVTAKPVIYGTRIARALGTGGIVNGVSGFGYAYGAGPRRWLLRPLLDAAYARSFSPSNVRIVVQNEADRAEVLRIFPAAAGRVRLIPGSGVDLSEFRLSPEPAGIPTVLLPARLLRDKGIREFAAAAALLRRAGVAARFVLAGRLDPANRGALSEREIEEMSQRDGVHWLGDCKDMAQCLRDTHVVCLPSYYREGVPKALLEACAAGRAIVTTDTPGCRDVVQSGVNGLLVAPRDVDGLATAIRRLVEDPALRQRLGRAGRARAELEFGVERVVRDQLAVYRELIGGSDAAA